MLPAIQLIVAILLIVCILLQQRGSGLGAAFGGSDSVYRTKRGAEKMIFTLTIILAVLFLGLALLNVFLNTQTPTAFPLPQETEAPVLELPAEAILMEGEEPQKLKEKPPEKPESDIFQIGEPKKSDE